MTLMSNGFTYVYYRCLTFFVDLINHCFSLLSFNFSIRKWTCLPLNFLWKIATLKSSDAHLTITSSALAGIEPGLTFSKSTRPITTLSNCRSYIKYPLKHRYFVGDQMHFFVGAGKGNTGTSIAIR